MYSEHELLPLSGLQHMEFCERRWALVQIENIWEDNPFTAEGRELHEKAHSGEIESRPGMLIRRTLPVRSFRLGLSGQADVVEFEPAGDGGLKLEGRRGYWRPYLIECKRSRDKAGSIAYRVQLCAQAMCFEEMLGFGIEEGAGLRWQHAAKANCEIRSRAARSCRGACPDDARVVRRKENTGAGAEKSMPELFSV